MTNQTHHLIRPPHSWWNAQSPHPSSPAQSNSPPLLTPCTSIDFLHPGYDDPANILFSLPAIDIAPNCSCTPGVHHGTALTACRIIALNCPGRLSPSRAPPSPTDVRPPWDFILTERQYYFHPDPGNDVPAAGPYPITPDFRSWRFPHRNLPSEWIAPQVSHACPTPINPVLTALLVHPPHRHRLLLHEHQSHRTRRILPSHRVPRRPQLLTRHTQRRTVVGESFTPSHTQLLTDPQFATNSMSSYNSNTLLTQGQVINDTANGFALRSDLNGPAFDAGKFVLVPKEGRLVLHFLLPTSELAYLFHNREPYPIEAIPREFLYARFAWSVFRLLRRFLDSEKYLVVATMVQAVWTYRQDFMRWGQAAQMKEMSKRKRGGGSGGTGPGGGGAVEEFVDRESSIGESETREEDDGESEYGDGNASPVAEPLPYSAWQPKRLAPLLREPLPNSEHDRYLGSDLEPLQSPSGCKPQYLLSPAHERVLDSSELEEDLQIQHEIFPEMETGFIGRDIAFYPGHRRVERLKQRLRRNREWVQALAGEGEEVRLSKRRKEM